MCYAKSMSSMSRPYLKMTDTPKGFQDAPDLGYRIFSPVPHHEKGWRRSPGQG